MMKSLRWAVLPVSFASALGSAAFAQSIPAGVGTAPSSAIGFEIPKLSGSFNYSLNAAELISTGFYGNGNTQYSTDLSGAATYLSSSTQHPFSAIYSGGVLLANSNVPTTTFQSLSLNQNFMTKHWNFGIEDTVSYLPESPVTGLSGIPGVGDLGIAPTPLGPDAGIGILTTYGPRVSNTVTGDVSRIINRHLSAQASAYQVIQRFIGDNSTDAVDNSGVGGTAGITYRLDARNSFPVNYSYSQFSYTGTTYSLTTQSGTVGYTRQWTRRLSTDVYAGPQHITNSDAGFGAPSTQIIAGASATYDARRTFYSLTYNRGVNNGSGVIAGSFADNLVASARHQFSRVWNVSASIGYSRVTQLPTIAVYSFNSSGVSAGGQVVRALGRRLSAYGSYTVENQTTSGSGALGLGLVAPNGNNAFNGTFQTVGLGISYSPNSFFLGR